MDVDLGRQLVDAKEKVAARSHLQKQRVKSQDRLKADAYRLTYLEASLRQIDREMEKLDGPGLTGLFHSIFGNKLERLEQLRNDAYELRQESDDLGAAVESIRRQLEDLESRIDGLQNAEADYAALFEMKERAMLETAGEQTARLNELLQQLARAQDEVRKTESAVEAGQVVLGRLGSMSRALQRARRKRFGVIGVLDPAAAAWNVFQTQGAKPLVSRVREGLDRFHDKLAEVDTAGGTDADVELVRLATVIEQLSNELAGGWTRGAVRNRAAAFPIEDEVRAALRLLEEKLHEVRQQASRMQQNKQSLIETA